MQIRLSSIVYYYISLFILSITNVILVSEVIQNGIFVLEMGMSLLLIYYLMSDGKIINSKIILVGIIIVILSLFHFIVNKRSDIVFYIKIIFPIIFYLAGLKIGMNPIFISENLKKWSIAVICILPIVFRLFQVITGYKLDTTFIFFVNSNNYAYYIFVSSIYILLFSNLNYKVIGYFIIAFLFSKTLGAILAISVSLAFFFRARILKVQTVVSFFLLGLVVFFAINSLNIYAFERVKNSFSIFNTLTDQFSLTTLDQVDYAYALGYAKVNEDLSFLFRIKQWTEIIKLIFKSDSVSLLFGHGLNTIPKVTTSGLVAHNDYLAVLYELGILLFSILAYSYFSALRKLARIYPFIFFAAIAIFHFTENLYNNFLITTLYLFLMGLHTAQIKSPQQTRKEKALYEDLVSQ